MDLGAVNAVCLSTFGEPVILWPDRTEPPPVWLTGIVSVPVGLERSGLVAQLNRWRRHPRPWRLCLWCLLVDVVSCSLVGFSVWLLAEREGLGYYESLWAAIVAGHLGARWFGLLIHSSRG